MQKILRTAIILVSAMIGSAGLIAGLMIIVENLTVYGNSPADFLPTKSTVAVLHDADQDMFERGKAYFPSFANISYATGSTIAILNMPNGEQGVASFQLSANGTLGPFAVTVSDPQISSLLEERDTETLGKDAMYKTVQSMHSDAPWMYIESASIPHSDGLREEVEYAFLYGGTDFIGIQEDNNHKKILKSTLKNIRVSIPQSAARLPDTIMRISLAQPADSWERMQEILSEKQRIIVEGIERQYIQKWGEDLSILDIHALLAQPSTFHLTATGGVMHFAMEGSGNNLTKRDRTLDRIHNSFAKTLPLSRITKRVLDLRFDSTDIRYDDTLVRSETENDGDWTIRGTHAAQTQDGVFTATNGQRFIISDSKETLKAVIRTQEPQNTVQKTGNIYSMGEIQQEEVQNWTETFLHPKDRTTLLQEWPNTLLWQTIINGSVQQIILQK